MTLNLEVPSYAASYNPVICLWATETLEDRRQLNTSCLTSVSFETIVSFDTNRTGKKRKGEVFKHLHFSILEDYVFNLIFTV